MEFFSFILILYFLFPFRLCDSNRNQLKTKNKNVIASHPVTLKHPNFAIPINCGHPVQKAALKVKLCLKFFQNFDK